MPPSDNRDPTPEVPDGMVPLSVRETLRGDNPGFEIVSPDGKPVCPTLEGVHCGEGTWWATPEAVARSAEIYEWKLIREREHVRNGD